MKKRIFIMLGVLGALILIFCAGLVTTDHENDADINQIRNQLSFSGFWKFSPILIDDTGAEGVTWAEVMSEPWCNGLGTPEDPYIIENVTINGNGAGDCFLIQNSDVYFIIRNSTFHNSGKTNSPAVEAGIKLNNVDNGQLVNNTCFGNGNGIKLTNCNNIVISENNIYDNAWWGIDFGWFHASGSYNIISRNIVTNNFAGISGASSGYECTGNLISENKVDSNDHYGIILGDGCHDNIIRENNVINNGFGGIGASGITLGGYDNLVYLNYVSGNYRNSKDLGVNNKWDDGIIGNYWDDYGGVDFDDNGIGDTPYLIYGSAGSQDNFPIWDDGDDPPYRVTIDCSGVDDHVKIYGMNYIPQGGIQAFDLEEGTYSLYSALVGHFALFEVSAIGIVSYDSFLDGTVLLGEGTSILTVVGHPITIDAIDVDQQIGMGAWFYPESFLGWTEPGTTRTYNLVANGQFKYGLWAYLTHQFAFFKVQMTGVITYDNTQIGIIEGNETSTVKAIGHTITIDATDVDQQIAMGAWFYPESFLGWIEPGTTRTFNLVVNGFYKYGLWAYFTHQFATFEIQSIGVITYDNSMIGIIEGNETSTVKAIGHLITIDATDVDQKIGMGAWFYPESFLGWIEPGTTKSYNLVVNGFYEYGLWAYYTHRFANFEVQPTGVIIYDNSMVGIIEGNETSTVKVIGHPITIDATDFSQRIAMGAWFYPESFLGWIEPGTTKTYNLAVNGLYNYGLWRNGTNVMLTEFTVFSDGSCSPNEILTDFGTIFINYDLSPPTTSISLSGTSGNNGWYISDVYVTLTATDSSGIERIEYCIDDINWIEYTSTFPIILEGITTLQYRSIDTIGNVENINTIEIKIDKTPPETQLDISSYYVDLLGEIYVTSSTEFTINSIDEISGIETIYYRINGGVWFEYNENFTLIGINGLYTIEYYSIDNAGNEELINSITVNLVNFEIESYLSKGEDNPITYFDIIFTKCKQTGEYKLVAINPGQVFYILEFSNYWPTSAEKLDIEFIIPNEFQLKANEPICIYLDGTDITTDCIINANLITIHDIQSGSTIKVVIHLDYGLKGNTYPSLDDFEMVGYIFNTVITGAYGDPLIIGDGLEQSSRDSATLITHQKKTTAIAGYVYDLYGNPIEGVTVELYLNGVPIKSIITDENGFYYFIDIDIGVYEVRVFYGGSSEMQVATASKDELTEIDFVISYEIP